MTHFHQVGGAALVLMTRPGVATSDSWARSLKLNVSNYAPDSELVHFYLVWRAI